MRSYRNRFVISLLVYGALLGSESAIANVEVFPESYYHGGSWDKAFQDAMDSCKDNANPKAGCTIRLSCGTQYEFSDTLNICRSHQILGCGVFNTTMLWPYGKTMVRFHYGQRLANNVFKNTCTNDHNGGGAHRASLKNLTLQASNTIGTPSDNIAPGILVEAAQVTLADLKVFRARGDGILVSADVKQTPVSNGNLTYIERVEVASSWGAGLRFIGGDANAGYTLGYSGQANCQNPKASSSLEPCAGLVDQSFLGNLHMASHTASNGVGYIARGASQHSQFLNPYAESDQKANEISQNSQVIGGLSDWDSGSTGFILQNHSVNRMRVINDKDPENIVEIGMGNLNTKGSFLEFRAHALNYSWPLRIKANPQTQSYSFDIANLGVARPISIIGTHDGSAPIGTLHLWNFPILLGDPGTMFNLPDFINP